MHGANEIIREAAELPIEERALVIDSLLKTFTHLNPTLIASGSPWLSAGLDELRSAPSARSPSPRCLIKSETASGHDGFVHPEASAEFLGAIAYYESARQGWDSTLPRSQDGHRKGRRIPRRLACDRRANPAMPGPPIPLRHPLHL